MITRFKLFEFISVKPKVGEYVIINNEIGKITYVDYDAEDDDFPYHIKMDYKRDGRTVVDYLKLRHIEYWSDSKEELEQILLNNKFNL